MSTYNLQDERLREHLANLQAQLRISERKEASAETIEDRLLHIVNSARIDMSIAWVQHLLGEPGKEANMLRHLLPPL